MAQPFEQSISQVGQQPLIPSPTQDPNEIASRTSAILPFVDNLKAMLGTPQGQTAALIMARSLTASRAPGEANGLMPRLVDGALGATSAIAQFNKNLSDSQMEDQKLGIQQQQADTQQAQLGVQTRGQDITARGQDIAATTAEAAQTGETTRANIAAGAQDRATAQRGVEAGMQNQVGNANVAATKERTQVEKEIADREAKIKEDQVAATVAATTAKYQIDKDANSQALAAKVVKAAAEASQLNGASFDKNFRQMWNASAQSTGGKLIQGPPADPNTITAMLDVMDKAVKAGHDPQEVAASFVRGYEAKNPTGDVDASVMQQQLLEAYTKKQQEAAASAATTQAAMGTTIPGSQTSTPSATETPEQELARLEAQVAQSSQVKSGGAEGLLGSMMQNGLPMSVADRKMTEARIKTLREQLKK